MPDLHSGHSHTSSLTSAGAVHPSNAPQPLIARTHSSLSPDLENSGAKSDPVDNSATAPISKVSTIKLDSTKIVPKNKRRGLFARLCLIPEYNDPRDYPAKIRDFLVIIIAFVAMIGPMGTSVLFPATDDATKSLHTTVSTFNFCIGGYIITLGVAPLWWSNFSERHGRRTIYLISFFLNICFTLGGALSTSIGMLIAFRALAGGMAASVQAVGAGTIADLYPVTERGSAMGWFYLGPLMGPFLSPIIGGAITSNKSMGWRGTLWFLVILGAASFLLLLFFLPETLRKQDNKESIRKMLRERRDHPMSEKEPRETTQFDEATQLEEPTIPTVRAEESHDSSNDSSSSEPLSDIDSSEIESLDQVVTRYSQVPSIVQDEEVEETPMDPNVPLSRVATTNTFKRKKTREQRFQEEVERAEKIQHGSRTTKFLYYLKIYGWGPLKAFAFLKYPPVCLAIAYSAPCFAVLYVCNTTLSYEYALPPYNFSAVLVGLVYIPNSVAYVIASIWGGKFQDYLLKKKIKKYGVIAPEARFGINVYVAAVMMPAALLITGWCLDKHEQWATPLVGMALFGFAQMIVIGVTVTYLTDCLPGRGATGVALNNFVRQLMAAGCTFATVPLIKAMGVGPLFSLCAGVLAILAVNLVFIVKKGDHWRETFDLESLYDFVDS